MYGKLFASMYTGTLATKGPWEALVTFQQLIILADREGVVDMTLEAVSRTTTIPLEIIRKGIAALERADRDSRSPDEGGRRITRLSAKRPWGWRIVNYGHYRAIRSQDDRREYMKQYQRDRRAKVNSKQVNQNQPIADAEAQAEEVRKEPLPLGVSHETWEAFKEMRRRIRKPLTAYAETLIWGKLKTFSEQGHNATEILNNSIASSWQGVFAPNGNSNGNRGRTSGQSAPERVRAANEKYR